MREDLSMEDQNGNIKVVKSKSNKIKRFLTFNNVLFVICAIGLVKQTIDLFTQYLSYQTVVNIKYEPKQLDLIPGITVCYSQALSIERVVQRNLDDDDELQDEYDSYLNKIKNGKTDNTTLSLEGLAMEMLNNNVEFENGELTYHHWFATLAQNPYNISKIDAFNLTIQYEQRDRDINDKFFAKFLLNGGTSTKTSFYPVEVIVSGLLKDETQITKLSDLKPLESIVFEDSGKWKKCFTFFSHLNETWRDKKMVIEDIELDVSFDQKWYPLSFFKTEGFEFSMHDPAEFPTDFTKLKSFRNLKLDYRIIKTVQTQAKELVGCRDYDLDEKLYQDKMRSECVKNCINDKLLECFNCSENSNQKCLFFGPNQWFERQIEEPQIKVTKYIGKDKCKGIEFHFETQCQNLCQPKCVSRYYEYPEKSRIKKEKFENSVITIKHSQLADQLTEIMPEMTLVGFASAFGGLLGLWLGLSAFAVSQYAFKLWN